MAWADQFSKEITIGSLTKKLSKDPKKCSRCFRYSHNIDSKGRCEYCQKLSKKKEIDFDDVIFRSNKWGRFR